MKVTDYSQLSWVAEMHFHQRNLMEQPLDDYDAILTVDVSKIDASWSQDKGWVGPYCKSGPEAKFEKYQNFGKFLKLNRPIIMPHIGLNACNEVSFSNGRHRFAYLRDRGLKLIPITTSPDLKSLFEERFSPKVAA